MKNSFRILALAVAVVAASVQHSVAQTPVDANYGTHANYKVAASATTNVAVNTVVVDCGQQENVAIKWTFYLGGAGTDVCGVRFFPSIDGTLPTTPTLATGYSMAIAANGATPVIVQTNFSTLGYRYLHLSYITNGAAQLMTNNFSYVVTKKGQ